MNAPQTVPPRRRLQELQAIPDRLRTESQWDELHELEISLAPGNRADSTQPPPRSAPPRATPPAGSANPRPSNAGEGRKPFRKRHRKPAKAGEP
ncbi:MAG: hypothetical protein CO126_03045 [Hydrogenophilales bacterium CG_4_9_14_3_um_filter_63_34]|nr:MAG: hypothetical protein COZ24_02025 [Hydrogenophilales bacterium CG_4_10_14_3_um_filter_63_21]PJB05767.1 MAG: hypothetical protein CO126_03045 [Hydrogenophilales bacterium CG_4_9_14_3_um_filter_63_34]